MEKDTITLTKVQLKKFLCDRGCYAAEMALELDRQIRKEKPNPEADKLICRSVGGIVAENMTNMTN